MENKTIKKVIWYQSCNEILIEEDSSNGSVEGEIMITCTPMGYQLRIDENSWKMFDKCEDLFKLLSEVSTEYLPIEVLAHKIFNIGYELEIIY